MKIWSIQFFKITSSPADPESDGVLIFIEQSAILLITMWIIYCLNVARNNRVLGYSKMTKKFNYPPYQIKGYIEALIEIIYPGVKMIFVVSP